MMQKILLCLDDSPTASQVVRTGVDLAHRYRAALVLLTVLDSDCLDTASFSSLEVSRQYDRYQQTLMTGTREALQTIEEEGLSARLLFPTGKVVPTIIEVAVREQADLIVMGGRKKSRLRNWLEGDVWADVARDASCDVLRVGPVRTGDDSTPPQKGKRSCLSSFIDAPTRELVYSP